MYGRRPIKYGEELSNVLSTAFRLRNSVHPSDVITLKMVNETVYALNGPQKGKLGIVKGVSAAHASVMFESAIAGTDTQQIPREFLLRCGSLSFHIPEHSDYGM